MNRGESDGPVDQAKLFLGIDLGTSSIKASLLDTTGRCYASASETYELDRSESGKAEQNPECWWRATLDAVRSVVSRTDHSASVTGIGLSGQMHGLVAIDRESTPVRPAIVWPDQRSVHERDVLSLALDEIVADRSPRVAHNPVPTGFQLASYLWLAEHEPGSVKRTACLLSPKDYLRFRLTGRIGTDVTDASGTLALDIWSATWDRDLLEKLHVDPKLFPPIGLPTTIAGELTRESAGELGLPAGVPVVHGGGDQAMQALGNGIIKPGELACTVGTGGQLLYCTDDLISDDRKRVHVFRHAVPDRFYLLAATLNAGLALDWFLNDILQTADRAESDAIASTVPAGSDGVIVVPYVAGERTPHMDSGAVGTIHGLRLHHTRAHLIRGVMEGIAFALRDGLDVIRTLADPPHHVVVSGGGARSAVWRQILADALDVRVELSGTVDAACVGAAICAAVGTGVFHSIEAACDSMVAARVESTSPSPENYAVIGRRLEEFRELYRRVRDVGRIAAPDQAPRVGGNG